MFKSQYKQDEHCYNTFFKTLPTPGFFVEVGASDGIRMSNTYFYEKQLGWSGLCVEPRENVFDKLVSNRSCFCEQVGIGTEAAEVDFLQIDGYGEGLSGVIDKYDPRHQNIIQRYISQHDDYQGQSVIRIQTTPLQTLLDKYCISHIHYLSVDTEGGELAILQSIDWAMTTVDVITVENNYRSNEFRAFLNSKGFIYTTTLEIDEVYVHASFHQPPVNVLFSSTWLSPSEMLAEYNATTPDLNAWRNIQGVDAPERAHVCVIMEGTNDLTLYDTFQGDRLICFPREPSDVNPIKQYRQYRPTALTYDTIYHCVPQFNFLKTNITELLTWDYPVKTGKASCIVSNKTHTAGARLRLEFMKRVRTHGEEEMASAVQVFGRGFREIDSKKKGLLPYAYSLCMENSRHKNYFTEKFTDAILCWTIPIYWGCSNIDEYFPKDSYYTIDITRADAVEELFRIIQSPITEKNIRALRHARNLILSKYNVWNTIRDTVNTLRIRNSCSFR